MMILFRFSLRSCDPMFLPGLMDYFNKNGIAAVILGAANAKLGNAAAAIADNVIFCWKDYTQDINSKPNVLKKSIKAKILIPGQNSENEIKLQPNQEVLALYVDRSQGKLGSEGRKLFCIEIERQEESRLVLPNCLNTKVSKDNIYEKCKELFKNLENPLLYSYDQIQKIIKMQGL